MEEEMKARGPPRCGSISPACRIKARRVARSLGEPERDGPRREYGSEREDEERRRKPQINCLSCKPICKPDAAGQRETGETEPTERDGICSVR
jgi:hypothetical protein